MSEYTYTVDVIGDDALTDSVIMRTVTEVIDQHINTISDYAFYGCTALKTVIGANVTGIRSDCFTGCTALETVSFPVLKIMDGYFRNCTALKNVDLPQLKDIRRQYAFEKCTALERIDLPVCTHIGVGTSYACCAFHNCSSLTTAILRSETMCELDDRSVFSDTPIAKGTGYIYVPQALIESYQAHEKWSTYADQFRAIEDYPDICGQYPK